MSKEKPIRKPLIISILALPVKVFRAAFTAIGVITYLPIHLYFLAISVILNLIWS